LKFSNANAATAFVVERNSDMVRGLTGRSDMRIFPFQLQIACMAGNSIEGMYLKGLYILNRGCKGENANTGGSGLTAVAAASFFLIAGGSRLIARHTGCAAAFTHIHHAGLFSGTHSHLHLHGHFMNERHVGEKKYKSRYEYYKTHQIQKYKGNSGYTT
jgi:hypothetical protein